MAHNEEIRKKAISRMDVIQLYMTRMHQISLTEFTKLYNGGDISRQLFDETGHIKAEDLERWTNICIEVGNDNIYNTKEESDRAYEASLHRYINVLETKIDYQLKSIAELKKQLEALVAAIEVK